MPNAFPPTEFQPGSVDDEEYSPLWDLNVGAWTQESIDNGYASRVIEEFQILGLVQQGWITGPGGEPFGSTGIIVNCPIVQRLL